MKNIIKSTAWITILLMNASYALEGQWSNGVCYTNNQQVRVTDPIQASKICGPLSSPNKTTPLLWSGHWFTTQWNKMSVCMTTTEKKIEAGPIWNNEDARTKCPAIIQKENARLGISQDPNILEHSRVERCLLQVEIQSLENPSIISSKEKYAWKKISEITCQRTGSFTSPEAFIKGSDTAYPLSTEAMTNIEKCHLWVRIRYDYYIKNSLPTADITEWRQAADKKCDTDARFMDMNTYKKRKAEAMNPPPKDSQKTSQRIVKSPNSTIPTLMPQNTINEAFVDALAYGVKGDGQTDNQTALQNAVNDAKNQGKTLWIPAGTYNHSGVLVINNAKVQGAGNSTILNATNPDQSAIKLTGNNSSLSNLKTSVSAPSRSSMPDPAAVLVQNASGTIVKNITIQGASSNGIRLDGATASLISNNLVLGTNADGIALMNGSTQNIVKNNVVYQAADDSYSDDSYTGDRLQDQGNVFDSNLSLNNAYGRGIVLAGSKNDTVKNNIVSGSLWYGIFADTDANSGTMPSSGHIIQNNTVINNPNGAPVQATAPGNQVSGTITTGSVPSISSILGWNGMLIDRYSFTQYQPGTGSGANNSGGVRN